ncbi:MAG: hypothetical protein ACI9EW_000901 [Cellvibrionaceae bacterium]|jgi:hypothetical protein
MNLSEPKNKQFSTVEVLLRLLKFTAAMATFFGIVNILQSGQTDIGVIINSVGFINVLFGLMSYLCSYLIKEKNKLAHVPILIGTLYPISVSLTAGTGVNIIVIGFGCYVLYQIWRLNQEDYFGKR